MRDRHRQSEADRDEQNETENTDNRRDGDSGTETDSQRQKKEGQADSRDTETETDKRERSSLLHASTIELYVVLADTTNDGEAARMEGCLKNPAFQIVIFIMGFLLLLLLITLASVIILCRYPSRSHKKPVDDDLSFTPSTHTLSVRIPRPRV